MNKWFVTVLLFLTISSQVNADDQAKIDKVIDVVERFCLAGKGFQFTADAGGRVTFKTLAPGAQGKVDVNIKETPGAVGYLKEEIRKVVDRETRECMQPYIDRVIKLIVKEV